MTYRASVGFALALALLAAAAAAVVVGNAVERQQRQVAAVVSDYFTALEQGHHEAALRHLPDEQRGRWRDFVANQLGNDFRVQAVSVRAPSLLDRWLRGAPSLAQSATIFVEINPGTPEGWRAATLVPLAYRDGHWYLAEPPLKPITPLPSAP